MNGLDRYLDRVGRWLPRRHRDELLAQLRTEIEELVADRVGSGRPRAEAIAEALTEFGPPDSLGRHLAAVHVWRAPRPVEVAVAVVALLVGSPLFAVAAVLVKLDSPGPVLYTFAWRRSDGRVVNRFKIRTMAGGVTRVGRLLRRTNFDEWPQLVNLLRGDIRLGELLYLPKTL
jgi:hypothetical protein